MSVVSELVLSKDMRICTSSTTYVWHTHLGRTPRWSPASAGSHRRRILQDTGNIAQAQNVCYPGPPHPLFEQKQDLISTFLKAATWGQDLVALLERKWKAGCNFIAVWDREPNAFCKQCSPQTHHKEHTNTTKLQQLTPSLGRVWNVEDVLVIAWNVCSFRSNHGRV